MDNLSVDLNNICLDDVNFNEIYSKIIIRVTYMAWHNRFKQCKAFQKEIGKQLMLLVAWHPIRWWDCCVPQDEKRNRILFC